MFFTAMAINSHSLRQTHIGRRFSTKMQGLWAGFKGLRGGPKKKNNILRIVSWGHYSQYMESHKTHVPNQQPVTMCYLITFSFCVMAESTSGWSCAILIQLMRLVPAGPAHGSCHCSVQGACNYSITWWFICQVFIASIHFPPRISMHFLVNFPILPACETPPLSGFHRGVHPQRGLWPSGQVWQSNRNS